MRYLLLLLTTSCFALAGNCQFLQTKSSQPEQASHYSKCDVYLLKTYKYLQRTKVNQLKPFLLGKKPLDVAPTTDKVYIDFVGTGDIQKSISEGKEINANTGIGIIYERFHGFFHPFQSFEFESYLNIFTTADTIIGEVSNGELMNRREFSTYLLNPISAKQSIYINANFYFGYPLTDKGTKTLPIKHAELKKFGKFATIISGLNARFIASNNIWKINDTVRNLGGLYARIGIFHEIFPDNYRVGEDGRSKYSCFFGLNYSFRGMNSDLSSKGNTVVRKRFLGTEKKKFSGIEFDFGFRLRNIRAEFQMPLLSGKKTAIEGLTNTQFLFSIKFVGGFSLKLNDSKEGNNPPDQTELMH